MEDFITVLTVRHPPDALMTKRLFRATNGRIGKTSYDNALRFDVQKISLRDLSDLVHVLIQLIDQPTKFVIRGRPTGSHHNVYRRLHGYGAAFAPAQHHWLFLDFDEVEMPLFIHKDDPEIALGYLVRLLPIEFHEASYFWQWSCGHGLDGFKTLRAHLWFWCDEPHADGDYVNWGKWLNGLAGWRVIDPSVLHTVQPNYTAAPVLMDDVSDPVPLGRWGIHVGSTPDVHIEIPSLSWSDHLRQVERDEFDELVEYGLREPYVKSDHEPNMDEQCLRYLNQIGDDKDGFYEPMTMAIWYYARAHTAESDADFKEILRQWVRAAKCIKQRDLDEYLSDRSLDGSLRGAREKQPSTQVSKLQKFQQTIRRFTYTRA